MKFAQKYPHGNKNNPHFALKYFASGQTYSQAIENVMECGTAAELKNN